MSHIPNDFLNWMRALEKTEKKGTKNINHVLTPLTATTGTGMMDMIVTLLAVARVFGDVNIEP